MRGASGSGGRLRSCSGYRGQHMYKIRGSDQEEYGPVSAQELRSWIADGRADANTPAQRFGETEWKPLSTFPEFSNLFHQGATAKQLPPLSSQEAEALATSVLNRDFDIGVIDCISRGWDLYKGNFWPIFGATALVMIASSVSGSVPYLGILIGIALNGVLYGGLYWYLLKLIRGEKAELADAFAGFNRCLVQLILAGSLVSLLTMLVAAAIGLPFFLSFIPVLIELSKNPHPNPDLLIGALSAVGVISLLIAIFAACLLSILWSFTLPLVIDKRLQFWDAMELSRKVVMRVFGSMLGLLFLSALLATVGILACCIGIWFTLPFPYLSIAHAYQDIFGDRPAEKW